MHSIVGCTLQCSVVHVRVVVCTVFRFVFISIQIQYLLTTSCTNFLPRQKMLDFLVYTTISADAGPFSQRRSQIIPFYLITFLHSPAHCTTLGDFPLLMLSLSALTHCCMRTCAHCAVLMQCWPARKSCLYFCVLRFSGWLSMSARRMRVGINRQIRNLKQEV